MKRFSHTLLTVAYQNASLVLANIAHTQRLHPDDLISWWIMDNTPPGKPNGLRDQNLPAHVHVFAGPSSDNCPAPMGYAYAEASYHHAAALNQLVRIVQQEQFQDADLPEPYLTVIDPDFYLLRSGLLNEVRAHMQRHALAVLGTPWNPVYPFKPRGLPCVHFLTLDSRQIPLESLDFRPAYPQNKQDKEWSQRLATQQAGEELKTTRLCRSLDKRLAGRWLGERRAIGSSLDTGIRLALDWAEQGLSLELLTPIFTPQDLPPQYRTWIQIFWDQLLPEALSYVPGKGRYCSEERFQIENAETFVWVKPEQPTERFGVHLRGFQRRLRTELQTVDSLLGQLAEWAQSSLC